MWYDAKKEALYMVEKSFELVMDKVFKEHFGKNKLLFESYKNIYDLQTVECECTVSKKLFEYATRKKFFVLLLIYDTEGKIYLDRNMSDSLYWGLPGGSIKDNETIHMTLNRISKNISPNIIIGDVEPLTVIKNKFNYHSENIEHLGIAFMARLRNEKDVKYNELVGNFIEMNEEEFEYINRFASKKVIQIYNERFEKIKKMSNNDFQENEIDTNEKYKNRYRIHNNFMKKYILTPKRKRKLELKKIIESYIGDAKSIIDVSCGEDQFIFNLAREKGIPLVVGNDISWSQVEMLNQKFDEVIFTNHNAAALPFKKESFDVAYCSNTLHHMPNKKTLINMLESMYRVSKKL